MFELEYYSPKITPCLNFLFFTVIGEAKYLSINMLSAVIFLGIHSSVSLAEYNNDTSVPGAIGLQKVEDASVISNEHTSKWRIFTDNGRDFFMKASVSDSVIVWFTMPFMLMVS